MDIEDNEARGILSYNPPTGRKKAILDLLATVPWFGAGIVLSFKEIEIDGFLNTISNSTLTNMTNVTRHYADMFLQNVTSSAPLIDARVITADVFQVAFGFFGVIGLMAHRVKNEASKLGLIDQAVISLSAFLWLSAEAAVNRLPAVVPGALIAQDIALVTGTAGIAIESLRLAMEGFKGCTQAQGIESTYPPILPREGAEKEETGEGEKKTAHHLTKYFHSIATPLWGTGAVLHFVRQINLESFQQQFQRTSSLGNAFQITVAIVAGPISLVEQWTSPESRYEKIVNSLLAIALTGWMITDGIVDSIPAAKGAQVAKGVFTGIFALLALAKFVKLLVDALDPELNCCRRGQYTSL